MLGRRLSQKHVKNSEKPAEASDSWGWGQNGPPREDPAIPWLFRPAMRPSLSFLFCKFGYRSCQSDIRTVNIQPAVFPKVLTTVAGPQEAERVLTMFNTMKLFLVPQMAFYAS